MPIYEYKCQQCGTHYEKRQSVSDPPMTTCEKCHGKLEKQWSLSGFQFKGAGWYVTDYSGNKNSGEKTDKSSGSDSTTTTSDASKSKEPAKSTDSSSKTE